ncbi:MAG: DNA topoisomerase (ATP-hydrolyzing) subunit B [Anaerotignum sp.]|nr:DNA topoisomerase (ATP-hydrolyzing) subunit B [Anaerotignum sp.]
MSSEYNASQIQVLEGLEAVRKRPGMYIGSTSARGLHHLVYEIVDNSVDEALAGFCNEITVKIHPDNSISVMDNGRGIPVDINEQKGMSALQMVFTILHAGGKFGGGGYKVSGGLHGVGASVVNALSEWLVVQVHRDGKIHEQRYTRGDVVAPLTVVGETDITGTFVHFLPDDQIFEETVFEYDILKQRFRETAFLTKGLKINLFDLREGMEQNHSFHYEGGIKEFVSYLNNSRTPLYENIFYATGEKDGVLVEVAFQHNDGFTESIFTFVNNINTPDGGTHLVGFKAGLTKTLNDYGKKIGIIKDADKKLSGEDVREGITAVVSIKVEDPQFEGQTKAKLGTSEAKGAVESILSEYLTYFLEENPSIGKTVIEKGMMASRARDAARKARELVRRKTGLENTRMPGKLTDCTSRDPYECEIYIVEGNSAGGSAIKARDPKTQAVLPLRDKILNVEKARLDRILNSEEIRNMITAFGTGISEDFDMEKLRYHKIVIMTDADVDGAHIRTLLLTFFYRYMPQLIEGGKVYIAQPPLYRVEKNKQHYYVYDDAQLDALYQEIGRTGIKEVQRYKGLGEMDFDQLRDTTMAVEHRILKLVTIDDAVLADQIFSMLMGDEVEPRKVFIEENAQYAEMDF